MDISVDDLHFSLHTLCKLTEHRRLYWSLCQSCDPFIPQVSCPPVSVLHANSWKLHWILTKSEL